MCQDCSSNEHSRRNFLKIAATSAVASILPASLASAAATPPRPQNVISPQAALERLKAGNRRYVKGTASMEDFSASRAALAAAQNPFASILSCADSRIAPEFAFDTGRGDLFVCRIAGNFANDESIASFEFGHAVLGSPLILVLGHTSCGAVRSTIEAVQEGTQFPGHIPHLVKALRPAVKAALKQPTSDLLEAATKENVILTVDRLKSAGPILSKSVEQGKLLIVGGIYHLDTGAVEFI